jgi:GST-like protein
VLDRQLAKQEFVAGDFYSIADISIWGWASLWEGQQQKLDDKPNLRRWLETVSARPSVIEGRALLAEKRSDHSSKDAQKALFKTK